MSANHVQDASTSSQAATVVGSPQASTFVNGPPKPTEVPLVIPPTQQGRTLVLCFDGTGDQSVTVNLILTRISSRLPLDLTAM